MTDQAADIQVTYMYSYMYNIASLITGVELCVALQSITNHYFADFLYLSRLFCLTLVVDCSRSCYFLSYFLLLLLSTIT